MTNRVFHRLHTSQAEAAEGSKVVSANEYAGRSVVITVPETIGELDKKMPLLSANRSYMEKLSGTVKEKNMPELHQLGGVQGVASALETDLDNGVHGNIENISRRKTVFGQNTLSSKPDYHAGRPDCTLDASYLLSTRTSTKTARSRSKWRLALTVIYASRALASLAKRKTQLNISEIVPSVSYTALDIQLDNTVTTDHHQSFSNIDQKRVGDIVKEKDLKALLEFGGIQNILSVLRTDLENGLHDNPQEMSHRKEACGPNIYRKPPAKGFFHFVMDAFEDSIILILLACAILSLVFGIKEHGWGEGWYEGGSIFVAVFLVLAVSAISNYRQSRQYEKLSRVSNNIQVEVVRHGRRHRISIYDIVVGDMVCLKIGDQIPADGLFVDGHSLQVDESSMTGESDHVEVDSKNPFLLSGAKVVDGYSRMLVTSVGMNTALGEMMSSIARDADERTPLQERLDRLTSSIGKIGLATAFLVLLVLMVRYFTGTTEELGNAKFNGSKTKFDDLLSSIVRIAAVVVTIVVVALPEGLSLSVTLTLAYCMKRMMSDHSMVRKLSACETMGSATTLCIVKAATRTLNQMNVIKFWLGLQVMRENSTSDISPYLMKLLHQGVGLNTTGSISQSSGTVHSGSMTEKAILSWGASYLGADVQELQRHCSVLHREDLNAKKKISGILVKNKDEGTVHAHWKGSAEIILASCSTYYDCHGNIKSLDKGEKIMFGKIIEGMTANSLRCIAFAHKEIPEDDFHGNEYGKSQHSLKHDGLTLLGIVGLKDPCRPGDRGVVRAFQEAGVNVKMITDDNAVTARAMAIECGILQPNQDLNNEAVVEGVEFRNQTEAARMRKVDKIRVMARSSPFDKLLMVQCLKKKGHVVAVTGDGTNDAPALKEAHIGLVMGIQGTEVAKESSDIVILDDDFATVATVLRWGRCVYSNIQKFIQFQLTVNVAALVINFISAVSTGEVPLTAVQLLWVNLIMGTLGALALATEQPTKELMKKPPIGRAAPLITNVMWRNLMAQALYQIAVLLTLQFRGKSYFGVTDRVKNTVIFNTFVLCQIFNLFNTRKLEKRNVFKGILKDRLFLGIVGIIVVIQVLMVELPNNFVVTYRLKWAQWGLCIGIAAISWPIGWFIKYLPVCDKPLSSFLHSS